MNRNSQITSAQKQLTHGGNMTDLSHKFQEAYILAMGLGFTETAKALEQMASREKTTEEILGAKLQKQISRRILQEKCINDILDMTVPVQSGNKDGL